MSSISFTSGELEGGKSMQVTAKGSESNLAEFFKRLYQERRTANPAYSQRAFARDLGISSGRLSEIFHGKASLSERSAEGVAQRLGLKPEEAQKLYVLVFENRRRARDLQDRLHRWHGEGGELILMEWPYRPELLPTLTNLLKALGAVLASQTPGGPLEEGRKLRLSLQIPAEAGREQ